MAEPFNPDRLMKPGNIVKMTVFEEGRDIAEKMLASEDGDEVGDLLEHAVDKTDRARAVIFYLLCVQRGWPVETGIEIVGKHGR